ncbi:MAG: signal peptidase II [Acidimicrobiales bacterium]
MVEGSAPVASVATQRAGARRTTPVVAVAAVVVVVDQLTKFWAVATLSDRDIDIFGSLRLHLERNSGAAFSVGGGRGSFIAVVGIAIVIALVWFARTTTTTATGALALGFVLGGAIGNLVDRFVRDSSAVVDFIDLQWWPVFNLADVGVTMGAIFLLAGSLRPRSASRS